MEEKMSEILLEVKNLEVSFDTNDGKLKSVNRVSFNINKGETLGVVGESGCGKSVTAMSIMKLLPTPPALYEGGEILFKGKNTLSLNNKELRKVRGNEISMVFQEPMSSLNPAFTVGYQIDEAILEHNKISKVKAKDNSIELIKRVGIARAEEVYKSYPHELSGGMIQRIMIAIALSCNPQLIIADEPTTALDVTIQAQILDIMNDIKSTSDTSIMMITHDLGVVYEVCDRVIVMYAGVVVETANCIDLFKNAKHPYTVGLLRSKPTIGGNNDVRLHSIPGKVPNLIGIGECCYFHDRCEFATEKCKTQSPPKVPIENNHEVSCWLYEGEI